ncbi:MAG: hypothetical protein AMXMBFR84_35280 [Candidatus Hydrogenedentota bacterium]
MWFQEYEAFVSKAVLDEIRRGDVDAARRRIEVISGFPVLNVTDIAAEIAGAYLDALPSPRTALADALHLARYALARHDSMTLLPVPVTVSVILNLILTN